MSDDEEEDESALASIQFNTVASVIDFLTNRFLHNGIFLVKKKNEEDVFTRYVKEAFFPAQNWDSRRKLLKHSSRF